MENWRDIVPAGVRFNPNHVELIKNYLIPRIRNTHFPGGLISESNVYDHSPLELKSMNIDTGFNDDDNIYVFSNLHKISKNGMQIKRENAYGKWKVSNCTAIYDEEELIGFRRDLSHTWKGDQKGRFLMKEYIIDRSADFALCHIYQKEDPKQKFNHDSGGGLEPNSLPGCQGKPDAHISVEKQKGGLESQSLSGKDIIVCAGKPDAHISVEKQKGGLESRSLSGKDIIVCAGKPDAHISVEKQKGGLESQSLSGKDIIVCAAEPNAHISVGSSSEDERSACMSLFPRKTCKPTDLMNSQCSMLENLDANGSVPAHQVGGTTHGSLTLGKFDGIADAKYNSGEKRKAVTTAADETFFPNRRSLSFDFDLPIHRSLEKDDGTAEADDAKNSLSKAVTPSSERRTREAGPEM